MIVRPWERKGVSRGSVTSDGDGEGVVLGRRGHWLIAWIWGFCVFWFALVSDACWESVPPGGCGAMPV